MTRSGDSSNRYPWQFGQVTTLAATTDSQPSQTLKFCGASTIFLALAARSWRWSDGFTAGASACLEYEGGMSFDDAAASKHTPSGHRWRTFHSGAAKFLRSATGYFWNNKGAAASFFRSDPGGKVRPQLIERDFELYPHVLFLAVRQLLEKGEQQLGILFRQPVHAA